jgi:flagellar protein FliL
VPISPRFPGRMTMADAKADVKADDFKGAKTAEKNPLLLGFMLLQTVFMGVMGYVQFTSHQKMAEEQTIKDVVQAEVQASIAAEAEKKSGPKVTPQDGINFPLEPMTVNLAQGDGPRRFLRFNAVLKFSKESSEEEFKARAAQIKDSVITLLNSKRPQDLLTVDGKNFLKEEIKSSINAFLVDGSVIDVYYVGFQIN